MRRVPVAMLAVLLLAASNRLGFAGASGSPAPNQLYGHITSDRTLTAASPGPSYQIIGDLTIDPGVTLTIERNVDVWIPPHSDYLASGQNRSLVEVSVEGALRVSAGSGPVRFNSTNMGWPGIQVRGSGSVTLENTRINSATIGLKIESGGSAELANCRIEECILGAFVDNGGTLTIESSTVANVTDGVQFMLGALGDVRNCKILGRGRGVGVGLRLQFSPSPADSVAPMPTRVSSFDVGVLLQLPGLALDHFIVTDCRFAVHADFNGHTLNYCTMANNDWNVFGSGVGGKMYNSVLVDGLGGFNAPHSIDYTDWWGGGFSSLPWDNVTVGNAVSSYDPFFVPFDVEYHLHPASLYTSFSVSGGQIGAYGPGPVGPTPVQGASVVEARGNGGVARVRWFAESSGAAKAGILRRTEEGAWQPLTVLYPDGQGYITLEDADVVPGQRYGYGVGVQRGSLVGIEGQVWVTVETPISGLAIASVEPNPATDAWSIALSTPEAAEGRIEVVDIGGRVMRDLDLGVVEIGRRSVSVPAHGLPPGVYWIRVAHGRNSALARAVKIN